VAEGFRAREDVVALLARTKRMNVVLVSIDALRADLLAPGAPDRADFPHITKLLDDSVWFTRAFAPASGTDISLATLLTGRFNPFQPVASTLSETMRASGRTTYAAIPNEVLRYAGDTLLNRGVDTLKKIYTDWSQADVGDHISADATTLAGVHSLGAAGDKPFFLWVHYFDVHEHHQINVPREMLAKVQRGASDKSHAYRALLRGIDDELGTLLADLDRRGLADKTIVVFLSDHGESLGEDPRLLATHGKVTYAPLVRVPIAFHIPGGPTGQRTDPVSLVDVAPTLFDLLGISTDGLVLDGKDLLPALLDGPADLRPANRALAIHEQDQWSVVEWPFQLLVRPADNLIELYDLEHDPGQRTNLAAAQPDVVQRLKVRFAEFPQLVVDRSPQGRSSREQLARQRPTPAPR
jgi:arylsulfatase A-like enzyme